MRAIRVVFVLSVVSLISSPAYAETKSADHQTVDFLPVNISFSCQSDTLGANRLMYQAASMATPGVDSVECVDKINSIDGIYPLKVEVVYRKLFDVWSIVLILSPKDAAIVNDLSVKNVGKKMVIGVNHRIFTKNILQAPLDGQKLYITVDSEKFGNDLTAILVDSKEN